MIILHVCITCISEAMEKTDMDMADSDGTSSQSNADADSSVNHMSSGEFFIISRELILVRSADLNVLC